MPDSDQSVSSGHRARLRQRFAANPATLSDVDLLELILTFAIPRLDVAPQARALLDRFGSPAGVLAAPYRELLEIAGIGEQTALFLQAIGRFAAGSGVEAGLPPGPDRGERALPLQAALFAAESGFSRTSREMTNGRESGNLLACLPTPAFTPPYRLR